MSVNYALCFKALGDETRFEIVMMLKSGAMCACKILEKFDITQPTLSYHMKQLTGCGLVSVEKKGTWNHYTINKQLLSELSAQLNASAEIVCSQDCSCRKG